MTLAELYQNHDGYVSDKWSSYLAVYERVLSPLKQAPISLLEVGVQNGGSLQIWAKYFSNHQKIVGCDINPDCAKLRFDTPTISVVVGDVTDSDTLLSVATVAPRLDIIIDDGSHTSRDIVSTFCALFPHLKQDGLFIVEDLHCSYWLEWEGGLNTLDSSMEFFKCLADIINFEHWQSNISRHELLERFNIPGEITEVDLAGIHSIEFVNSMCIIKRRPPQQNTLGIRNVVGVDQNVCAVKHTNGSTSQIIKDERGRLSEVFKLEQIEKSLEDHLFRVRDRLATLKSPTAQQD